MNRIGDYKLIEKIGAGGMGEVWRAENVHTHVPCAIKLLPGDATSDKNFVSRFFDEGRVMQTLEHPYIVRVHHVGEDKETGRYFLAEDLIERASGVSISLHDLLTEAEGHRLPEADVRKWATQVAEALAYAHEHGVIHRDIKPANVLIDDAGNAKVTDFGLAKAIGEEYVQSQIHVSISLRQGYGSQVAQSMVAQRTQAPSGLPEKSMGDEATMDTGGSGQAGRTTADALLGTYDYMSPEQRGELAGVEVSPASDIYAFGVMIYRLLTGRRPAGKAKDPSVLVKGLSRKWDVITDKCLEHRPEDRYADGSELLKGLGSSRVGVGFAFSVKPLAVMAAALVLVWLGYKQVYCPMMERRAESAQGDNQINLSHDLSNAKTDVERAVLMMNEAETQYEKVLRLKGVWPGYSPILQDMELQKKNAVAFYEKGEHGLSAEYYQKIVSKCAVLEKLEAARLVSTGVKSEAEVEKKRAEASGAARDAAKMWSAGQAASKSGAKAYAGGDFKKAEVNWREAVKQYTAATEYAEEYQKAELARKREEEVRLKAEKEAMEQARQARLEKTRREAEVKRQAEKAEEEARAQAAEDNKRMKREATRRKEYIDARGRYNAVLLKSKNGLEYENATRYRRKQIDEAQDKAARASQKDGLGDHEEGARLYLEACADMQQAFEDAAAAREEEQRRYLADQKKYDTARSKWETSKSDLSSDVQDKLKTHATAEYDGANQLAREAGKLRESNPSLGSDGYEVARQSLIKALAVANPVIEKMESDRLAKDIATLETRVRKSSIKKDAAGLYARFIDNLKVAKDYKQYPAVKFRRIILNAVDAEFCLWESDQEQGDAKQQTASVQMKDSSTLSPENKTLKKIPYKTTGLFKNKREYEPTLLIVPSKYSVVQLAFDLARAFPLALIAYEDVSVTDSGEPSVMMHIWNPALQEWVKLADKVSSLARLCDPELKHMIVVGPRDELPKTLLSQSSGIIDVAHIPLTSTPEIIQSIGIIYQFTSDHWASFLGRVAPNGGSVDSDGDGLTDEVRTYNTDPLAPDTDYDGLKDGEEVLKYETNPLNRDTDGGGVADGHEIIEDGTDPLDPADDLTLVELYIQFDYDKAVVKPQYFSDIDVIAKVLARNPEATAVIEGHADQKTKSSDRYNQKLSERRAKAVMSYLVSSAGIKSSRLKAVGYGFSRPKVKPDLRNGNPENRRIEVYIRGVKSIKGSH